MKKIKPQGKIWRLHKESVKSDFDPCVKNYRKVVK